MDRSYTSVDAVLDVVWKVVEFATFAQRPTVHCVGIFGNHPLEIAVTWGNQSAVTLLLDAGADIDAINEEGNTALHHALQMGHFDVARLLIGRRADQSLRNDAGKLPRDLI
jgi:ankyrin repeat protein